MAKLKTGRHTSAIKAARQAEKRQIRNRATKKATRETTKAVLQAIEKKDATEAQKTLKSAVSAIDKAQKKGSVHWKTAARRKSRLASRVAQLAAK
ncbi:MAG: 30S ribosomal protein S20 [Elusimicrobia bacterium CG1_02_63_36]|nr:MAG: 30S ribosomal protein S20 [Elusimicrobia bacterium CG1_02_63_36]PIP84138.1 MAG: 30S ribosomal protein S20 [Elusimicrobia bacterium CG22_combo_CG10-13_8_21_14_all_63_91]PJA16440.1 MAG: 30S ribosomal protein S20 [Elusimicrobia bacterium CG_4_10_14_0_2_um_filter_63_34]PJB25684.1 MAG: 30S ribosomal protein S20 [Elusimicrobia bacterium CG_4_9_14_3_um_filter_62_55]